MAVVGLAARSAWNRRGTAFLTIFTIAVSVALLLGVQKIRTAARDGFASTISGTDLIVGARSSPVNLLLYSVFRMGDATANVTWPTYQLVANHRDVAWTVPISLGDSHRGYRVMGTSVDYFRHYRYAQTRQLAFASGAPFKELHDAVLGADVAASLGYRLEDPIVIAHGVGAVSFADHGDQPFRVAGSLARTGTPVDRTVHVSLEALTAIHAGWQRTTPSRQSASAQQGPPPDLAPPAITAFLVGMRERSAVFQMQRALNEYTGEPLLAIIPGVALQQLWEIVGVADRTLMIVAGCVVFAGLLGMLTAILTSLNERRREMAILRSVGAHPLHVFTLLISEAGLFATLGVLLGVAITYALLFVAAPLLASRYGIFVAIGGLSGYDFVLLAAVIGAGLLIGLIPAWRAYRHSLADGLTIRV